MKYALYIVVAAIAVIVLAMAVVLSDIQHDVHTLVTQQRFTDCVMSPAGDEMLCKRVTATDPPYQP